MSEYTEQFISLEKVTKSKTYGVRLTPQLEQRLLSEINQKNESVNAIITKSLALYFYIKDNKNDYNYDSDTVINILIDKNTKI